MKTEYDISTKEKRISYLEIVDDILYNKLGFKLTNSGTKYLRDLIIYIYIKNEYEYSFERELKLFLREKNMKTNFKTVKSKIVYAINNVKKDKVESGFYSVFQTEYDPYYLSIKNIVSTTLVLLEKYKNML